MNSYRHRPFKQVAIYFLVGLAQLAVDVALFQALVLLQLDTVPANFLSRFTAAVFGYLGHKLFTFGASWKLDSRVAFAKFISWWIAVTLLGGLVLGQAVELMGTGTALFLAKTSVELITAAASFLVFRFWVFSAPGVGGQT